MKLIDLNNLNRAINNYNTKVNQKLATKANVSHGTHVTWSTTIPKANGTATVGTETKVARGDHVHPLQTTVSGNAGTATKLATARTLTIGNKGKTFDGSGNVSWTLAEIGAARGQNKSATTPATAQWYRIAQSSAGISNISGLFEIIAAVSGRHSITTLIAGTSYGQNVTIQQLAHIPYSTTGISKARIVYHTTYNNNYAYLEVYLSAAAATYIEVRLAEGYGWTLVAPNTVGSIPSGYSNKSIDLVAGKIVSDIQGTATKLATARTLTIGNKGKTFDGSGNVSWSLSEIGAAASSHTHSYLPLSGGTMSGQLTISLSTTGTGLKVNNGEALFDTDGIWNDPCENELAAIKADGRIATTGDITAWGKVLANGSLETYGSLTIGGTANLNGNTNIADLSVKGYIHGETCFVGQTSYEDPWNGIECAIKATGNIACTGYLKGSDIYLQGYKVTCYPYAPSSPSWGDVWIQNG